MTNTTREEKPKEDKGLFLQLPYILIDTLNLSDSAYRGFINFCRQCLQKDKTIRYSGSYRQLATYIKQSRMTCYRSVEQWITANLIVKEDTPDGFILTGNLSSFWSKNADHCKTHQRPKMGQSVNSTASQNGTSKAEQRPKLSSAASQTKHSSVPNLDANEHENDPLYTVIDTLEDTFFSDGESGSYSQDVEQPETPEKKGPSMADWFAELDAKMDALDAEYSSRLQENKAHQSTQTSLFQDIVPAAKSAAPKLPNMTRDVLQRENRPPTVAEQKRIDEREQREKAQQVTRRKAELWTLFDGLFGSRVDRAGYNKSHVEGLALNPLATDPIIKQAFESVAKSAADKKDPTKLTITNVANVVPAYIRTEQIKVVQSKQPKQETELERMKREQREAMAKRALQEVAQ